ncbi:MAG: TspO/MBR family protein [Bosea sp. (in: a-proteobacteria)]
MTTFGSITRFPFDKLAYSVLPIIACSFAGNAATQPNILGWYAGLIKPAFNPPNWLFPIAWTILFALMAYAVFRIWKWPAGTEGRNRALVFFYVQLALNCTWSFAFFGSQSPLLGLAVIVPFLAMIILTIRAFNVVDPFASWLLWPYAAWVSFATLLNVSIYALNR